MNAESDFEGVVVPLRRSCDLMKGLKPLTKKIFRKEGEREMSTWEFIVNEIFDKSGHLREKIKMFYFILA